MTVRRAPQMGAEHFGGDYRNTLAAIQCILLTMKKMKRWRKVSAIRTNPPGRRKARRRKNPLPGCFFRLAVPEGCLKSFRRYPITGSK